MAACLPTSLRRSTLLYYSKYEASGIWKIPLSGGEEEPVLDRAGENEWYNWALGRSGVYFLQHGAKGGDFDFFDFATSKTTTISTSDKQPGVGLALAADGKTMLLYAETELEDANIMLVKTSVRRKVGLLQCSTKKAESRLR